MIGQHRKPTLAFIVLAVLAAAVIGSQYRADADSDSFKAHGAVPAVQPADDERGNATKRATRSSRGGTERVELPPAAAVIHDSGELAGTHSVESR